MIDTLMHYSETPNTTQQIAMSAFSDGLLMMLLNHKGAFLGPGWH